MAAFAHDGRGQSQQGRIARIFGLRIARLFDLRRAQARALAEGRMRGEAVAAIVGFADGQGDLFALPRREAAAGSGAGQLHVGVQRDRRVGEGAEHVRQHAELGLDGVERGAGGGVDVVAFQRLDVGHDESLRSDVRIARGLL